MLTSELVGDVTEVLLRLMLLYQQKMDLLLDHAEPFHFTRRLDACTHHASDRVLKQLHSARSLAGQ